MKRWLAERLPDIWYGSRPPPLWLRLLSRPAEAVIRHRSGRPPEPPPLPVIVVGNITVGGTGKTPLVIHLARMLTNAGHRCGVISRGYGGRLPADPVCVEAGDDPATVGDEPLLIRRAAGIPVWVCRRRRRAMEAARAAGVETVISDDGLQHRALPRSLEICLVDGRRRFGNGRFLPAGPLRDLPARLETVDMVVCRTQDGSACGEGEEVMWLKPTALVNLGSGCRTAPEALIGQSLDAVAGIGNPEGFFRLLESLGYSLRRHPRSDHARLSHAQLSTMPGPVVMTGKDAIKISPTVARDDWWYLDVEAGVDPGFDERVRALLLAGAGGDRG